MQLKSLSYGNYPLNLLGGAHPVTLVTRHEAAGESVLAGTSRACPGPYPTTARGLSVIMSWLYT
jgi:hypothetical protein